MQVSTHKAGHCPVWRRRRFLSGCSGTQLRPRKNDHLMIRSSSQIGVNVPCGERSHLAGAQRQVDDRFTVLPPSGRLVVVVVVVVVDQVVSLDQSLRLPYISPTCRPGVPRRATSVEVSCEDGSAYDQSRPIYMVDSVSAAFDPGLVVYVY